jgi:hypothetical protein
MEVKIVCCLQILVFWKYANSTNTIFIICLTPKLGILFLVIYRFSRKYLFRYSRASIITENSVFILTVNE